MIKKQYISMIVGTAMLSVLASCSQSASSGGYDNGDLAQQVADGEVPPWIADGSADSSGTYTKVTSSGSSYTPKQTSSSSGKKYTSSKKYSGSKKASTKKKSSSSSKKSSTKKSVKKSSSYSVRSGDSLSRIASRNGTTVSALKRANGLKSDMIRPGQKLTIPRK